MLNEMEEPKLDLTEIQEPEKKQEKKKRKLRKPKRLKYFNSELVNEVYIKNLPTFTCPNENVSISVIKNDNKDTDFLSHINTEASASHRAISLKHLITKPQHSNTQDIQESPLSLKERRQKKTSSMIQINSLSRFSSNPSLDYLQSPLSTEQPLVKKSKFNLKSETFLPKITNTNSTFNDLPSQFIDNHPPSSMNSINQDTDTIPLVSAPQPASSIFCEDINKQGKSYSCVNSPLVNRNQGSSLKRLKHTASSSTQLQKRFLPQLNDTLALTQTQRQQSINASKSYINQIKDQKSICKINQANSPSLQFQNNLPSEQHLFTNHQQKIITNNLLFSNSDSKKYNKYASYIDLPPQKDMRQEIFKLLSVKSTPTIHVPQKKMKEEAVVVKQAAPEKPKIDYHMIQIRKQIKQKFKRAKLRLRILLGFFNKLRKATSKRREFFLKELQTGVLTKEAISDIMIFSMRVSKESLLMLFEEDSTLDYFNYKNDRKNYILRRQRLRQFTFNITSDFIESSNKFIDENSSFIKFISLHTRNYSHVADQFWPKFILERLEFTNYGQIKNITQLQRKMIAIYLYFVYGICNRLVRPWQTLKIEESYVKEKNAQLVMSLIFYMMIDYIKDKIPLKSNSLLAIAEEYQPKVRQTPLNTYNDVLQKDYIFQIGGKRDQVYEYHVNQPDFAKIKQELEQQVITNENIMIGLHPRQHLEDLVSGDEQMKKSIHSCFEKGATLLLSKVYSFNLNLNENLFNFID